jgi:hypothetical protein
VQRKMLGDLSGDVCCTALHNNNIHSNSTENIKIQRTKRSCKRRVSKLILLLYQKIEDCKNSPFCYRPQINGKLYSGKEYKRSIYDVERFILLCPTGNGKIKMCRSIILPVDVDLLCGLVVRVPGYRTEIYYVSCEVLTEFMYVM